MELPEKVALYVRKPELLRWQDNPEEPRDWAGAARFLGLTGADAHVDPIERLEEIRAAFRAILDLCTSKDTLYLTRRGNADSPIHISDLANVLDFLVALTYRFPESLEKKGGLYHRFPDPPGRRDELKSDDTHRSDDEPFWDWD
jgi:hypothetical protein